MQTLALFDFDGTITHNDSLLHFTKYAKGRIIFYGGMLLLSPVMLLNKAGILNAQLTKNIFLKFYFTNMPEAAFEQLCDNYAARKLKHILKQKSLEQIQWHKERGHRVIVVSASLANYIQPWCNAREIECLATRVKVRNGQLTGNIDGLNCNHNEKRRRIEAVIDVSTFSEIYGYGDTAGDNAMLALCTKKFYRYL